MKFILFAIAGFQAIAISALDVKCYSDWDLAADQKCVPTKKPFCCDTPNSDIPKTNCLHVTNPDGTPIDVPCADNRGAILMLCGDFLNQSSQC
ncbi:hypothetical protein BUE80_DR011992 [Diplocarpon rosae]|nr:hypothetical protein BUE80_DR011992 [Diplocarpon rosae]